MDVGIARNGSQYLPDELVDSFIITHSFPQLVPLYKEVTGVLSINEIILVVSSSSYAFRDPEGSSSQTPDCGNICIVIIAGASATGVVVLCSVAWCCRRYRRNKRTAEDEQREPIPTIQPPPTRFPPVGFLHWDQEEGDAAEEGDASVNGSRRGPAGQSRRMAQRSGDDEEDYEEEYVFEEEEDEEAQGDDDDEDIWRRRALKKEQWVAENSSSRAVYVAPHEKDAPAYAPWQDEDGDDRSGSIHRGQPQLFSPTLSSRTLTSSARVPPPIGLPGPRGQQLPTVPAIRPPSRRREALSVSYERTEPFAADLDDIYDDDDGDGGSGGPNGEVELGDDGYYYQYGEADEYEDVDDGVPTQQRSTAAPSFVPSPAPHRDVRASTSTSHRAASRSGGGGGDFERFPSASDNPNPTAAVSIAPASPPPPGYRIPAPPRIRPGGRAAEQQQPPHGVGDQLDDFTVVHIEDV